MRREVGGTVRIRRFLNLTTFETFDLFANLRFDRVKSESRVKCVCSPTPRTRGWSYASPPPPTHTHPGACEGLARGRDSEHCAAARRHRRLSTGHRCRRRRRHRLRHVSAGDLLERRRRDGVCAMPGRRRRDVG